MRFLIRQIHMTNARYSLRASAFGIDLGLIAVLQVVFGGGTIKLYEAACHYIGVQSDISMELLMSQFCGAFLFIAYFTFVQGLWGTTVGKKSMNIQVLMADGKPLTLKQSYWRALSYLLSSWTYCIGFILPFFRKDKLALHDLLCGTQVVAKEPISKLSAQQPELPHLASVHQLQIPTTEPAPVLAPIKKAQ